MNLFMFVYYLLFTILIIMLSYLAFRFFRYISYIYNIKSVTDYLVFNILKMEYLFNYIYNEKDNYYYGVLVFNKDDHIVLEIVKDKELKDNFIFNIKDSLNGNLLSFDLNDIFRIRNKDTALFRADDDSYLSKSILEYTSNSSRLKDLKYLLKLINDELIISKDIYKNPVLLGPELIVVGSNSKEEFLDNYINFIQEKINEIDKYKDNLIDFTEKLKNKSEED